MMNLSQVGGTFERPEQFTLIDDLKNDSAFSFVDNISTHTKRRWKISLRLRFKKRWNY